MTDDDQDHDRPGEDVLRDAIEAAIAKTQTEWVLTMNEVVGVLYVLATRYAHRDIAHQGDDE